MWRRTIVIRFSQTAKLEALTTKPSLSNTLTHAQHLFPPIFYQLKTPASPSKSFRKSKSSTQPTPSTDARHQANSEFRDISTATQTPVNMKFGTGKNRVQRGGSWNNSADRCRAAYRNRNRAGNSNRNNGLRACLVPSTIRP